MNRWQYRRVERRSAKRRRNLTFSPAAWLKLQWLAHAGDTEVGGFGISDKRDPLYVQEFVLLKQYTTATSVQFDDNAVADYYDNCVDRGLTPDCFSRVWIHSHPGSSPQPSGTDEQTFERVFGPCDWAVMFIVSRTGRTYARLRFNSGPGGQTLLATNVDWEAWPALASNLQPAVAQWECEFTQNVIPLNPLQSHVLDAGAQSNSSLGSAPAWPLAWELDFPSSLHEQQATEAELARQFELTCHLLESPWR